MSTAHAPRTPRTHGPVLGLTAATDPAVAGRKAATLARFLAAGFDVPDGAVVTTAAFDAALDAALESVIEGAAGAAGALRLPDGVATDLDAALAGLGDVPLAVRSSAVDEDTEGASYAGMYTSVLGVRGAEALREAVLVCWRSAFTTHVERYRGAAGDGVDRPRFAVLVQGLVPARAAGVAFTVDPVSGARDAVVIDAVAGLADRLVSGEVDAERWTVPAGGTPRRTSPDAGAIDAAEAAAVAALARRAERELGTAADIEWVIDGERLRLVQARPVTALPAAAPAPAVEPVPLPVTPPPGYWEREASHSPLPWTPLTADLASCRTPAMRRAAEEVGLLVDTLDFRDIGGWEYVRIVPLGGRDAPALPPWAARIAVRLVPALRRRAAVAARAARDDVPGSLVARWHDEWRPRLERTNGALRDVDLTVLDDAALGAHLDATYRQVQDGMDLHFRLHAALCLVLGELARTSEELLGGDGGTLWALLSGSSTASTGPARALRRLAGDVAGDAALRSLVTSGAPAAEVLAADAGFAARFAGYQREFGCRVLRYEIAEPSLEELPDLVLALLRDQLATGFDPDATHALLAGRRTAAADDARAALASRPAELARFERALRRGLAAYPVREDNEFFTISMPFALVRRAVLEAGRRLAARGVLGERDDAFFLTVPRLRAALDGDLPDAAALVRRARGERAWALANPGPASYGTPPPPPPPLETLPPAARDAMASFAWTVESIFGTGAATEPAGGDGGAVRGVPASAGSYTGPVRVVRAESEFGRIRPGDVLVCPVTSPVWSVVFPAIGALVTDSGGALSHPAIIAREYGIPAVVATGDATSRLRDGDIVTVDGTTGTVTPLSGAR